MTEPSTPRLTVREQVREQITRAVTVLPKSDWLVIGWVLASKILLFIFGIKAYQVLEDKRATSVRDWLELWNHWDAPHYLQLAQMGYTAKSVWKAWFYPLFPWSVRVVAWCTGNYLISALLVSAVALPVAAILFRRLVRIDFPSEVALRSVWFFLIFPTAFFLHVGYTESLFLAFAIGSVFAARKECWWAAGGLGALSWMTRANGAVLIPALAVEAAHQFWTSKRWNWQWLWIGIIPVGFGVYLLLNWRVTGDPFTALRMRKTVSVTSWAPPWIGIREAVRNLHRSPGEAEMVGAQELYFSLLGLACVIASWIKLRPLYAVWATGNWLLFNALTFIESAPRYTLVIFPLFILFGLVSANRFWNAVISIWSLLFLALFTATFVRGWWAF
jgi:Mannosyltransferase (PIG-V)